jgi:hypothetical protein
MRMAKFALTMAFAVAGLVLLANQRAAAGEGIPLKDLAGNYASTCQGTFSICLDSTTFSPTNCGTGSPVVVPLTDLDAGALTRDERGNACSTFIGVDADLPVDKTPPLVSPVHPAVAKTLDYDPATGTGDISVSEYRGGKCIGSTFDNAGATQTGAFVFHFAVSNGGKRIDMIVTSATAFVTDTTGNFIGDFSLSCANLRQ